MHLKPKSKSDPFDCCMAWFFGNPLDSDFVGIRFFCRHSQLLIDDSHFSLVQDQ